MNPTLSIRQMAAEDLDKLIANSKQEGWFYNDTCVKALYEIDPKGFYVGEIEGKAVAWLVLTKCGNYCYSPIYVVEREYRKAGFGTLLQKHSETHIGAATIGIDVFPDQAANRRKIGFEPFCSTPAIKKLSASGTLDESLIDLRKVDSRLFHEYDQQVFGNARPDYVSVLLSDPNNYGLAKIKDGQLVGFGVLRKLAQEDLYGCSPFFADDKETAKLILQGLQSFIPGKKLHAYAFDANQDGKELFEEDGWVLDIDATRMYRGAPPKMEIPKIYGYFE